MADHSHEIGQVADDISAVAGGIAAIAAPIPIVGEVVTPIAGTISLATGAVGASDYATAARTPDGTLVLAYIPTSRTVTSICLGC